MMIYGTRGEFGEIISRTASGNGIVMVACKADMYALVHTFQGGYRVGAIPHNIPQTEKPFCTRIQRIGQNSLQSRCIGVNVGKNRVAHNLPPGIKVRCQVQKYLHRVRRKYPGEREDAQHGQ